MINKLKINKSMPKAFNQFITPMSNDEVSNDQVLVISTTVTFFLLTNFTGQNC